MRPVAVDRRRICTSSAGPRRFKRRQRWPRRDQKHCQAHEYEEGYDDRNLHRQNEGWQFFQHGQCRDRRQKIISARSPASVRRSLDAWANAVACEAAAFATSRLATQTAPATFVMTAKSRARRLIEPF